MGLFRVYIDRAISGSGYRINLPCEIKGFAHFALRLTAMVLFLPVHSYPWFSILKWLGVHEMNGYWQLWKLCRTSVSLKFQPQGLFTPPQQSRGMSQKSCLKVKVW